MKTTRNLLLLATASALLLAGCAPKKVREADKVAKTGDWDAALAAYKVALAESPNDKALQERVKDASTQLALEDVKKAEAANAIGHLGEAGDLWKKALDLTDDATVQQSVKDSVESNRSSLEYYGDISAEFYDWPDAIGAYGALLIVDPANVDLVERYRGAKREYAGDLTVAADDLARKNLDGAALVTGLRALQNDPMQQVAFDRVSQLRAHLAGRTKVAIPEVTLDDRGNRAFGLALVPKLTPKIDKFPPYGPTKDAAAIPGKFTVSVVSYDKSETTKKGEDTLPWTAPSDKTPIVNPAIADQQKKIAGLEKQLAGLKSDLKAAMPPKPAKPTPSTKKPKLDGQSEAKRQQLLTIARQIDDKRKEIDAAKVALAALPATVPPPPPPATWTLPWVDVTRTVTAKVRFELWEKDYENEPIVLEMTKTVSHTDRQHDGNEKQGVLPDRLDLPTFDAMNAELADQYVDGAQVIAQARSRRVDRLLAEGRKDKAAGDDDAALDAFVQSLFILGPDGLPQDAAVDVTRQAENDELKTILGAGQPAPTTTTTK